MHAALAAGDMLRILTYLEACSNELETRSICTAPTRCSAWRFTRSRGISRRRVITPTSLIAASNVPYATANRRLKDMIEAGLIDQRPRTKSGKSFSMHPSDKLLEQWSQMSGRVRRLAEAYFGDTGTRDEARDYYFGGSYMTARAIPPIQVLPEPLKLAGGMRVLVHGDPTFMVMENLKRQFEQVIGVQIHQRAFSIDRLRAEALRNAERMSSRYDIIALDLPWMGEFVEKNILMPLDEIMDVARLDPADFHTAGWKAAHWGGGPMACPRRPRRNCCSIARLFAEAGLEPPAPPISCWRRAPPARAAAGPPTASAGMPRAAPRWAIPC